jgi:iron complex outermembrane receptor protein
MRLLAVLTALDGFGAGAAEEQTHPEPLNQVVVIGTAPLPGSGIDIAKVPSNVQTVSAAALERDGGTGTLVESAARRLSSVTQNQEQGSAFQPDFVFRGFEASPIAGIAQGIAVYQNGTRINEAFGDTVNWDLLPQYAVQRMTVQSNNPVFGLNALGGAVTLEMKTGFDYHGAEAEFQGGSYGNQSGHAQFGRQDGNVALYVAAGATQDGGFRYQGRTTLRQAYADAGYQAGGLRLHASLSVADDDIGAAGSTPLQMLAQNPRSVFTYPQSMHNRMQMLQISASARPADTLQLGANLYLRHFSQDLVDGNTTDVRSCANDAAYFCLEGAGNYPGDALYSAQGSQVPASVLPSGATPGETDYTRTATDTLGSTWQATWAAPVFGLGNHLVAGASVDRSVTDYGAHGELGILEPDLSAVGVGVIIDQAFSGTAQPPLEEPVALRAVASYYGVYFTNTLDLGGRIAWTLSARLNTAVLSLRDRIGTSLDGDHRYSRVNPGTGLTYRWSEALSAYAGYSESNRAPTAGELSCANPALPCLLDTFLLSDPPLRQVIAHTTEAGLRGSLTAPVSRADWHWNLGIFRTDNADDILRLPTEINGFGYFSNVGTTRRQGLEFGFGWQRGPWDLDLSYSRVDATFREALALTSNSPAADANGNIQVRRGDHLPLTPVDRLSLQFEYSIRRRWAVGADARYAGPQYLVGDESNQEPRLPASVVFDLHSTLHLGATLRLFARVENLLDRTNYAYGTFTNLHGLPPNFQLTDNRAFSPAPGRTFYLGVQLER